MFSEMIAIWIISFWEKIGCPKNINIIELGAGNGEMMLQILRTVEKFNKFKSSSNFIIYEKSTYLKKLQKSRIKFENIKWINNLKKISKYPSIFIANEFFDALPIKQFVKKSDNWYEKYIINKSKSFDFFDKKTNKKLIEKLIKEKIPKNQKFIEFSPLANEKLNTITKIIKKNNGGLLIIDYGYNSKKMFDTLQSIKKHKKNNILENIYKADITHLINFNFFKQKIRNLKISSVNLTTQRKFLLKMGILERAEIISKNMPFSKKSDIYFRLKRLIDKKQMGTLFKVLFATNKKNNFNLGF
jgi:cyclopropane-fatty-acyl-phospholipid synthase